MKQRTCNAIREIAYQHSGISLGPQKKALISARVGRRMRTLRIDDPEAYLDFLRGDNTGKEIVSLLDAISTNVTIFFREMPHFVFLRETVSKWAQQGQEHFRFWSAACSTGEEPYSMAITIEEALVGRRADVKILATDISTDVLQHSLKAEYSEQKVKVIPAAVSGNCFEKCNLDGVVMYRVRENLRRQVLFRRLNLSQPPFPMRGPLDFVFCRNVMIYFDNEVRKRLLDGIFHLLKPDGYLIVGHTESLTGMVSSFKSIAPSIYVKG